MRWNARRWRSRPPASNKGARRAWDFFIKGEALPVRRSRLRCDDLPARNRTPKEMTYRFMDYWVWVMEFENGDYEEIDALELRGPNS